MIRKNGAGDLQRGEKYVFNVLLFIFCSDRHLSRYCNIDFIIFAALMGVTLLRIIITYDVICWWSIHFRKRMAEFPESMQISDTTQVDVAIPGWHIHKYW